MTFCVDFHGANFPLLAVILVFLCLFEIYSKSRSESAVNEFIFAECEDFMNLCINTLSKKKKICLLQVEIRLLKVKFF